MNQRGGMRKHSDFVHFMPVTTIITSWSSLALLIMLRHGGRGGGNVNKLTPTRLFRQRYERHIINKYITAYTPCSSSNEFLCKPRATYYVRVTRARTHVIGRFLRKPRKKSMGYYIIIIAFYNH